MNYMCLLKAICLVALFSFPFTRSVGSVDFKLFDIDSTVNDIVWCGNNQETILALTELSSVYKSDDHGFTWKKLNDIFQNTGRQELEENENEIGKVTKLILSPVDKSVLVFLGTHGINWITEDCGRKVKALNHGRKVQEYMFHPTERNWGIASAFSICDDYSDEPCKINKEIFLTQDLGQNWVTLASYVVQFGWGLLNQEHVDKGVPRERILLTYEPRGKGHQRNIGWNYKVDFIYSDDFFKTKRVGAHKGNKFLLTKNYLFVAQVVDQEDQEVALLVTNPADKFYNLQPIDLSQTKFREHSYTFLDTTENSVFIHVNHFGEKSKHGHIYISDAEGQKFSLSLHNNVRMIEGQCDFDRVNGLEGIYIANVIDQEWMKDAQQEIQQEEVNSEESMTDKKPKKVKETADKIDQFKDFIQTYITFNKGGKWNKLKAPERDKEGKRYECGENCFINLHGISSSQPPFYSVDSAAGIIIANGSVGKYLSDKEDEISTFLSRDGGFNWFEVRKGSHIYEIGNHGALILMAEDNKATNTIIYSWDEGNTWNEINISKEKMFIRNIIIEPTSTSQHFVVYGYTSSKKGVKQGLIVGIDFSSLHEPMCRSPMEPNTSGSDYETWTPNDGRLGHECLLGKKTIYIRRKREAECYNPQTIESKSTIQLCDCVEEDYECDIGFSRDKPNDPCTSIEKKKHQNQNETSSNNEPEILKAPEVCHGYYTMSKGYRKIPGDQCINGVKFDPILIPCPGGGFFAYLGYFFFLILVLILGYFTYAALTGDCIQRVKEYVEEKLAESREKRPRRDYYNIDPNDDDNTIFEAKDHPVTDYPADSHDIHVSINDKTAKDEVSSSLI